MQKVRNAPPDPTLPKPWRGLIDCSTNNLYFWNPETKVTTYERPTADPQPPPQPDMDNRIDDGNNSGDRSHQIQRASDVGGYGDNINKGDLCHQSQEVNRDTSSRLNDQQSVPASEAHGEDHGNKSDMIVMAKRKHTSESHTLKKTVSKKQKTTSPPLPADDAEGHFEELTIKPTEVSHSVDKEQDESNEIYEPDPLAKETQKVNQTETFNLNVSSSICTTLVSKEMGTSLPGELPIMGTDPNKELLRIADGPKYIVEEIDHSKKQKETSPPSDVDAADGHVEMSIMKPSKVCHSGEKEQPEYYKVYKSYQLEKETPKMNKVEGEVPQSASIIGAELLQVSRSETFELNVISSTNHESKETGTCLPEDLAIMITNPNQELLSVADGPKRIGEYMIDGDGLADQGGRPIKDNMLNDNVDCLMTDLTQIETKLEKQPINQSSAPPIDKVEKQPINQSSAPPIDKVEEDVALTESIDRLAGITDRLAGVVEAMRYVTNYSISARETEAQLRRENQELNKKIAELEEKLNEAMVGNQLARCQFSGSPIAGSKTDED